MNEWKQEIRNILRQLQGQPVQKSEGFNCPRGCGPARDYWDLTMFCLYHFFYPRDELVRGEEMSECYTVWWLLGEQNSDLCIKWLEESTFYEPGDNGWYGFIMGNFLQDCVNQRPGGSLGTPRELWDRHFAGSVLPEQPWQYEKFFNNASAQIAARGTRIAVSVKEKLNGLTEEDLDRLTEELTGENDENPDVAIG